MIKCGTPRHSDPTKKRTRRSSPRRTGYPCFKHCPVYFQAVAAFRNTAEDWKCR